MILSLFLSFEILYSKEVKFLSIRSEMVNMRTGPDNRYNIKYTYVKKYLPFKIIDTFNEWYFVIDPDLESGWIKKNLFLHSKKQVFGFIQNKNGIYCYKSNSNQIPEYKIDNANIVKIISCNEKMCLIEIKKIKMWCQKNDLWGV